MEDMKLLGVEAHVTPVDGCRGQSLPVQPHPRSENAVVKRE